MSRKKVAASRTSHAASLAPSTSQNSKKENIFQRNKEFSERVRTILASKDLTLYKVFAQSRSDHPAEGAFHVPANLYFRARSSNWTPTLHQLSALNSASNYHLVDWLTIFGFSSDAISRVQAILRHPRTTLLDATPYDSRTSVPWFREREPNHPIPRVASLSEILERSGAKRLSSLGTARPTEYLYGKIGTQDALAFPELLPGSIVRANPHLVPSLLNGANTAGTEPIFLVEHQNGYCCCRLHFEQTNRITLLPTQLPFANVEFQLGTEAKVIGVVDMEFRALIDPGTTRPPRCGSVQIAPTLARLWTPRPFRQGSKSEPFAVQLRHARSRAGLSFRDASKLSRSVAGTLGDKRYFISQASLSDYEARHSPPRHIHKLFALCAIYAIPFRELLLSFGISLNEDGTLPIPDHWMPNSSQLAEVQPNDDAREGGFVRSILEQNGPPHFFLHHFLANVLGVSDLSLHDVFWVGVQRTALHPALAGALFAVINRKRRTPPVFLRKSVWDQALYLLARRDGSYALASCTLESGLIIVHPYTKTFVPPERLRNRSDAEIVGQIVAVVRTLRLPPT